MGYLYDTVQKMRVCARPLRFAKSANKVVEPVKEEKPEPKKTVKKAVKESAETDSGNGKQP